MSNTDKKQEQISETLNNISKNKKDLRIANAKLVGLSLPLTTVMALMTWGWVTSVKNANFNKPIYAKTEYKEVITVGTDGKPASTFFLEKDFPTEQLEQTKFVSEKLGPQDIKKINDYFDAAEFKKLGGRNFLTPPADYGMFSAMVLFIYLVIAYGALDLGKAYKSAKWDREYAKGKLNELKRKLNDLNTQQKTK